MIKITNLKKTFGGFAAVDGISFDVQPGEVLGFLGPNGAGKSTTMKMLTGFLTPTEGLVSVMGHDVRKYPKNVQAITGYLPEGAPAYGDMTVLGFLQFVGQARGFRGDALQKRIEKVVANVALEGVLNKTIDTLSKGFKRRVGIAQAILHDPQVLILDEPTDGLDPNQKHQVRELIRNLAKDKIVIISTHILEEVSAVCTRALIISAGKVVFDGSPVELAAKSLHHNAVSLKLTNPHNEPLALLRELPGVRAVEEDDKGLITVFPEQGQQILKAVNHLLHEHDWDVEELHLEQGRLDEVFRAVTQGEAA